MNTDNELPVGIPIVHNPSAPRPDKLKRREREEARGENRRPAGWWALSDLSGSLEGVTKAVQGAADVPAHWKAAIIEDLRVRCSASGGAPEFNFVYLDAHCYVEKGNVVLHYHATPDRKLL